MKKAIIGFLALALLGAGAAFAFAHQGRDYRFGKMPFGGRGFERIAERLNLTNEQKSQIKTILEESKTRVKPLMETVRDNHQQAAKLGSDGVFNEEEVNRLAARQAELVTRLFIEKERTKAQISSVLTPEQRVEAVKIKENFMNGAKDRLMKRFGGDQDFGGAEK